MLCIGLAPNQSRGSRTVNNSAPNAQIEKQLAEAGLQVTVDWSDGALVLGGIVDTEEARRGSGGHRFTGRP